MDLDCRNCPALEVAKWKQSDNTWQSDQATLANVDVANTKDPYGLLSADFDVALIFAQGDKVRECPRCRKYFTKAFTVPELWWSHSCRRSNGYFGCEDMVDKKGDVTGHNTWFRALIKPTFKFRKNEEDEIYYRWLKFNVFTRWLHSTKQTIILVFDPFPQLKERLPRSLLDDLDAETLGDPYWIYAPLVEEIVRLQDNAVWTIRDLVREIEKDRSALKKSKPEKPRPNYPLLHDIARHAIHVSETLDLAVQTAEGILREHEQFISHIPDADRKMKAVSKQIHRRLLFYDQMLHSLRSRSTSNKDRLLNEIGLAFHTVAQYDSRIFVEIGRAAKADSAAMKGVAFVTLTFLPATFISAIFSMTFFNYGPDSGSWSVSDHFWIYWAVSIPITILTWIIWYGWNKLFPPISIGEEEQQVSGEKRVEEKVREVAKKLRWNVEDGYVAGNV